MAKRAQATAPCEHPSACIVASGVKLLRDEGVPLVRGLLRWCPRCGAIRGEGDGSRAWAGPWLTVGADVTEELARHALRVEVQHA